jgi:hypothetical protein
MSTEGEGLATERQVQALRNLHVQLTDPELRTLPRRVAREWMDDILARVRAGGLPNDDPLLAGPIGFAHPTQTVDVRVRKGESVAIPDAKPPVRQESLHRHAEEPAKAPPPAPARENAPGAAHERLANGRAKYAQFAVWVPIGRIAELAEYVASKLPEWEAGT